jgi:4'-phosphopantetheinyl transferase
VTPGADVLVWLVDADAVGEDLLAACAAWLGASERARSDRFLRPARRRQFIVGRGLVRLALGRLLACAPSAIVLRERTGQAPELVSEVEVGFSVSHSGRWVACAAATGMALGLDIEGIDRARDVAALAEQAFESQDLAAVLACAPHDRHAAFYRLWCRHEARIKLGRPSVVEYAWQREDLSVSLASSMPLASTPVLTVVRPGDW